MKERIIFLIFIILLRAPVRVLDSFNRSIQPPQSIEITYYKSPMTAAPKNKRYKDKVMIVSTPINL